MLEFLRLVLKGRLRVSLACIGLYGYDMLKVVYLSEISGTTGLTMLECPNHCRIRDLGVCCQVLEVESSSSIGRVSPSVSFARAFRGSCVSNDQFCGIKVLVCYTTNTIQRME